jgi:hypothetical protein
MGIRRGVVALVVLALSTPTAARADEVPAAPTSIAATATAACSVGYTATVTAADGSVPEGTVRLTAGGTVLREAPLVDGSATWYAGRSTVTRQEVTYVPADGRWAGSTSEVAYVDTGTGCASIIKEPAYLSLRVPRIRAGQLAPISVAAFFRGNVEVTGEVAVRVTGPRGFSWSRTRPIDDKLQLRGPRLARSGNYLVEASFTSTEWSPARKRLSFEVRPRRPR